MAFNHGVTIREVPTQGVPIRSAASALPFVVGIAPVTSLDKLNKPVLCTSYRDFVEAFGSVSAERAFLYGLSEFADVYFNLYGASPAVFVAVAPEDLVEEDDDKTFSANDLLVVHAEGPILLDLVVVKSTGETPVTYTAGTDYTVALDPSDPGRLNVTRLPGGAIASEATVNVEVSYIDVLNATPADVIGGVDPVTGLAKGLAILDAVPNVLGIAPMQIVCPGFSTDSDVALAMISKAQGYAGGNLKALALIDIPSDDPGGVLRPGDVRAWKLSSGLSSPHAALLWPRVRSGSRYHWFSSHLAGIIGRTDATLGGDAPYVSPSSRDSLMTGSFVLDQGEPRDVFVTYEQAKTINEVGVICPINRAGSWVAFGNGTSAFDQTTDPKDALIPVRRMFSWVGNSLFQNFFNRLDMPLNVRNIQGVLESASIWLAALVNQGALLGGRISFLENENSKADLMAGRAVFHLWLTPPSPNQEIEFRLEYDAEYLDTLFGA